MTQLQSWPGTEIGRVDDADQWPGTEIGRVADNVPRGTSTSSASTFQSGGPSAEFIVGAGLARGVLAAGPETGAGLARLAGTAINAVFPDSPIGNFLEQQGAAFQKTTSALKQQIPAPRGSLPREVIAGAAEAAPGFAQQLGLGVIGGAVGGPAGAYVGFTAPALAQVSASQLNEAMEYHSERGTPPQEARIRALTEVGAANIITTVTSLPVFGYFTKNPLGQKAVAAAAKTVAGRVAGGAALEGGQEVVERVFTEAAAGLARSDPKYFNGLMRDPAFWRSLAVEGLSASVLGGIGGAATGNFKAKDLATPEGAALLVAQNPKAAAAIAAKPTPARTDMEAVLEPGEATSIQQRREIAAAVKAAQEAPQAETAAAVVPPAIGSRVEVEMVRGETSVGTLLEINESGRAVLRLDEPLLGESVVSARVSSLRPHLQEAPAAETAEEAFQAAATPQERPADTTSARKVDLLRDSQSMAEMAGALKQSGFDVADMPLLGLDFLDSPERRSHKDVLAKALARESPTRSMRLAAEMAANPRPLDDVESTELAIQLARLKKEHRNLSNEIRAVQDDPGALSDKVAEINRVQEDHTLLIGAMRKVGAERGRALASQKLTIDQDFDLVSIISRATVAKGSKLSVTQQRKMAELTEQLQAKDRQVAALEQEVHKLKADQAIKARRTQLQKRSTSQRTKDLDSLYAKANELIRAGCH